MGLYVLKRFLQMIPVLWIVATVTFFLMRLAPGGPFDKERRIPPEVEANLKKKYHFDEPILKQYFRYMSSALQGDLGPSYKYAEKDVTDFIRDGFPISAQLGLMALAFALVFGILPGVIASLRQNSIWDYGPMSMAMLGVSIPNFVLGPLLVLVFSMTLYWLPPARWDGPSYWILPTITLGSIYAAYIARLTRGGMLEVVRQDYIRTARAKGLPEWRILIRHTIWGGMLPVVSFLGPATAHILTGSVVVEKIFLVPGLGRYFIDAAINRDYTLVLGVVLFDSCVLILLNLVVDVLYGFLDPRVTYD